MGFIKILDRGRSTGNGRDINEEQSNRNDKKWGEEDSEFNKIMLRGGSPAKLRYL